MPQWLDILIGLVAGTALLTAALAWAFWPQKPGRRFWFAPPTGSAGDPTSGGSQWSGDGGFGGTAAAGTAAAGTAAAGTAAAGTAASSWRCDATFTAAIVKHTFRGDGAPTTKNAVDQVAPRGGVV